MTQDLKTKIAEAMEGDCERAELRSWLGVQIVRAGGLEDLAGANRANKYIRLLACLDSAPQAALQAIHDAGYAVVRREPIEAMIAVLENFPDLATGKEVYAAMLAAAQPKAEEG